METAKGIPRGRSGFDRLAVIDLETTGLDPETGLILEVGVVVVDRELREITNAGFLVADDAARTWADNVRRQAAEGAELDVPERMHLDNGLVDDLLDGGASQRLDAAFTVAAAEAAVCQLFDAQGITEPVPLAGSSVRSLDGPFLRAHMPNLFSRFNHRTIDASALSEFARFTDPDGHAAIMGEVPASGHRTVGDCRRSLEMMRRFAAYYGIRSGVAGS